MKKRFTSLIIACLLLTGCKSVSIETASQNLENSQNYSADISLEINGKFNNKLVDFTREKKITIDNINASAIVEATETQNKKIKTEKYYLKSDKDTITTYKKIDNYYQSQTEAKDTNSLYYITAYINQNSSSQYIETKKGIVHYVVTLPKDRVKNFLNSYYSVDFFTNVDFNVNNDAKINVYVNSKNKMIQALNVDFASVISFDNNSDYQVDRFYLEIDYNNYNKAGSVEIPKVYIQKAIDKEIIDSYNNAVSYVNAVNNLSLGEETTTYTDNSLNYDGTKPDDVSLTVLKGKVISGTITINKYKFKVESGVVNGPGTAQKVA